MRPAPTHRREDMTGMECGCKEAAGLCVSADQRQQGNPIFISVLRLIRDRAAEAKNDTASGGEVLNSRHSSDGTLENDIH